jgi:hypothetical protein
VRGLLIITAALVAVFSPPLAAALVVVLVPPRLATAALVAVLLGGALLLPGCATAGCDPARAFLVWEDCLFRYGPSRFCAAVARDLHCPAPRVQPPEQGAGYEP